MRPSLSLCIALFSCLTSALASGQTYTFTRLAGTDGGAGFVDGKGSDARFIEPLGLVSDAFGNVYVSDRSHAIRKVTPDGVVTTVAGLADSPGWSDGAGAQARFRTPKGLAIDSSGILYVADEENAGIRKVTQSGLVSTYAGVLSSAGENDGDIRYARFNRPGGVAVDATGNVYVVDTITSTIRKVFVAGYVSTIAGSAYNTGDEDGVGLQARFRYPEGIAVDRAGVVYVADSWNHTIRKIMPDGTVTTVAGSPGQYGYRDGIGSSARFDYPRGLAVDDDGNVYVADRENSCIRKIAPDRSVSTVAGRYPGIADGIGTEAQFYFPNGVAILPDGDLVVADGAQTIRRVTKAGVVTTLAGKALRGGSDDGPVADATFSSLQGLTVVNGDVYVADRYAIRKISGGNVSTYAGSTTGSSDGSLQSATFDGPAGIVADSSGTFFLTDQFNHTIRKLGSGYVTTWAGLAHSSGATDGVASEARFSAPFGVALDVQGNLIVADTQNEIVRKISADQMVTTIAGSAGQAGSTDGTGADARFFRPSAVACDAANNVYVADTVNNTIRKIAADGVVTTLAGNRYYEGAADGIGSEARFNRPVGIASDAAGNLVVVDGNGVRTVSPGGVVSTISGPGPSWASIEGTGKVARFRALGGVALDSAGSIYLSDSGQCAVYVGKPALPDLATVDDPHGIVGAQRQLDTLPQTASSWSWTVIRRPSTSTAELSSPSVKNPTFTPDVADLFVFRLVASDGVRTSVTNVSLDARPPCAPPVIELSGTGTTCIGSPRRVQADLTGTPPWNLVWSDGLIQNGVTDTPVVRDVKLSETRTFSAVVTNACGSAASGEVTVTVVSPPTAEVYGTATIHRGESTPIRVELTGTPPWTVYWSDSVTQVGVTSSPAVRTVSPDLDMTYTATVTNAYCWNNASGNAVVTVVDDSPPTIGENLLENPDFDVNTNAWCEFSLQCEWSVIDSGGSPTSGSLVGRNDLVESNSFRGIASQCVDVPLFDRFLLRGKFMTTSDQSASGNLSVTEWWYPEPGCTGSTVFRTEEITARSSADGAWQNFETRTIAPYVPSSLMLTVGVAKIEQASSLEIHVDDLFAGPVAVFPASGKLAGGTYVVISGTGFQSGASVQFGEKPAREASVYSSNRIFATTDSNDHRLVDIVVTNRDGRSAIAPGSFMYAEAGDANADGVVDAADVFFLVNYLFAEGPEPVGVGDVTGDNRTRVKDLFYLINFIFASGQPPI